MSGPLVTFLPKTIRSLELRARRYRTASEAISSVFRHLIRPFPLFTPSPLIRRANTSIRCGVEHRTRQETRCDIFFETYCWRRKVQAESGETVRWGVQRRLEFIDFRLFWDGRFNRRDLAETFGISAQQASSDIAQYTARAPDNLVYDQTLKAYLRTATYEPKLMHASAERYLLQLVAIENRWMRQEDTWFDSKPPIENVSLLRKRTDAKILLSILDAINRKGLIEVQYKSISGSPQPSRIIAPHSLFYAVNRWYVRSWSKDHSDFRDYNLFRINHVGDISPAKIDASLDFEWEHQIDLILAPNPLLSLSQQAALEEEYGMSEGRLVVTTRLSQSFYIMTEHNLDVAPGILPPEKQQLILTNREEVVGTRATARKMSIDAIGRISR